MTEEGLKKLESVEASVASIGTTEWPERRRDWALVSGQESSILFNAA